MATLHLMVGLPCSGKTTLARKLETELGALRLTPDEWHRFLFGQDATDPEHDARHDRIEALQWRVASTALARGLDVILDFGFWARSERQDYRQRAAELGAGTKVHYLDVPFDELLRRLDQRNVQSTEDITIIPRTEMLKYRPRFEPPGPDELAWSGELSPD